MRRAYGLLGILFLILFAGVFWAFQYAEAPEPEFEGALVEEVDYETNTVSSMTITSTAFTDGGSIPAQYTCDGDATRNPPFSISGVPAGTESLVLVMDDPDIPQGIKEQNNIEKFDHWVAYNIPADTQEIAEGESIGTVGFNGAGSEEYRGPCPPSEYEPTEHRYIFRLYALPEMLSFESTPTLDEVEAAAAAVALESVTLVGRYERQES